MSTSAFVLLKLVYIYIHTPTVPQVHHNDDTPKILQKAIFGVHMSNTCLPPKQPPFPEVAVSFGDLSESEHSS